tara:strand:- start:545 stop:775 length:231 start_codon:yes stop_codon:yes gene_type:complete
MRVTYQSGEVYLSMTKEEVDHLYKNKGNPVPIGVRTLKILHEDVSNCVRAHWSNVEVWEAVEEHLQSNKSKSKSKK